MTPARRRVLNVSALVGIVVVILGGGVATGRAIMHARDGMGQVQRNEDQIEIHKTKIHNIEAIVIETHTIVTRIDKRLDREHP